MTQSFTIIGQRKLDKLIRKVSNPSLLFDADVRATALQGLRMLVMGSHGKGSIKTGNTARGWQNPIRLTLGKYVVSNNIKTKDKKHLIVNILNKGRGEVTPKKSKFLYIPLTNKGAAKGAGRVFGVDYVLSKKSRAVKGTKFMDIANKKSSKDLFNRMEKTLRSATGG